MKKLSVFFVVLLLTAFCYSQGLSTSCSFALPNVENKLISQSNNGRAVADGHWYYYDNGNFEGISIGVQNGASFSWGVMFPAGTYSGDVVTKVSAYDCAVFNGTVTIYNGGNNAPTNPVGSKNVTFTGSNTFREFTFDNPVAIDPTKNVWVVFYKISGNSHPAAVCANTGNPNGRWVCLNGTDWYDIANDGNSYTFMIRAYIENYGVFSEGFESGIPSNWTLIDADGDGHNWTSVADFGNVYTYYNGLTLDWYHNGSNAVVSCSFINDVGALTPDNFLVMPPMSLGSNSQLSFWVAACDPSYPADHFGVFVSTTGTNPSSFVSVQEWTLTGKSNDRVDLTPASRNGRGMTVGTWHNYTVNLNYYSGQQVYIAFRHFNCSNQYIMALDDIQLTNCSQSQGYTINVSSNPSSGGNVTGGGSYLQGTSCTVHANPANGYTFLRWTENGTQVSTNANYTFTVTGNRNLVAQFQAQSQNYTISVSANPTNGGTAFVGNNPNVTQGVYTNGQSCTVHASANSGYSFTNWTENNNVVSTQANYTFSVTGNRTLVANFVPQQYSVNVSANPSNGGSVTGGGTYNFGQSCTVSATPSNNFSFNNWTESGNVVSTQADYTFEVNNNRVLVANFTAQEQNYTISASANPTNGGTVTGGGTYTQGQSCTVKAIANDGYAFTNWTENGNEVSTDTDYVFTVNGNRTLVANFTQQQYTITAIADPLIGGNVTGSGQYHYGDNCILTATPNDGYVFSAWTKDGDCVGDSNPSYSFVVESDGEYIAHFVLDDNSYTINVTADPFEGGTVSGGNTYNNGALCTLIAYPNDGYYFESWTKDGEIVSQQQSYSFTVSSSASYVAHFIPNKYEVTANVMPAEGGEVYFVFGTNMYEYGSICALTAIPSEGYVFVNWTKDGEIVETDATYQFAVTQDVNCQANFSQSSDIFTISASPNPINGGEIIGAGNYPEGETCTLKANASPGYVFAQWLENDEVVSSEAQYSFVVERHRTLVARFNSTIHKITATSGPNGTILPEGVFYVETGESITFTMIPDEGCSIKKVIIDGNPVSPVGSITFSNVSSDRTIHVDFSGVGVEENEISMLKILPNPVKEVVLVDCPGMRRITLYNMTGTVVYDKETQNDKESIHVERMRSGVYIVRVLVEGNHYRYAKLIVSE